MGVPKAGLLAHLDAMLANPHQDERMRTFLEAERARIAALPGDTLTPDEASPRSRIRPKQEMLDEIDAMLATVPPPLRAMMLATRDAIAAVPGDRVEILAEGGGEVLSRTSYTREGYIARCEQDLDAARRSGDADAIKGAEASLWEARRATGPTSTLVTRGRKVRYRAPE